MTVRCVALLSGGLDSVLAVRLMQEQNIEVDALNFKTTFTCCQDLSAQAAHDLNIRLTVIGTDDEYLDLVRNPKFGYGRGANPCVDCRIYMFAAAREFMQQVDAQFVVSGEVVGQRPMSQKREDLDIIADQSGLADRLLRPLSAKVLRVTRPERERLVDRRRLYGYCGRGRKKLIALAHQLGVRHIPQPSTGCSLTEPRFSRKVYDLIDVDPGSGRWDFELLNTGRHFRWTPSTKIVIGRNENDNRTLRNMHDSPDARSVALVQPDSFAGATALIVGELTDAALDHAGALILRYSKVDPRDDPMLDVHDRRGRRSIVARQTDAAQRARSLAAGR